MSLSGLTQSYVPNTLDGLNVIEADQIYIDGQLVDLTNYVPYTGADKPVDVGAQPIRTTYAPVATNDVVNLQALTDAVTYVDTSVSLTYLSKISTVAQSVAGPVTFTNGLQTSTNKDVSLASTVIITPNYPNATVYDGGVTAGSRFGTITNSGGVYQSTSSGDGGVLVLGSGLSSGRVRLMINLLVNDTNGVAVSLFGSSDGINPYQSIASHTFPPNTTTFWVSDTTFTLSYPYIILICNTASPGLGATVQWYGLTLYQMGVAMNNVTLPAQTGDRVVVLDANKRLVSSGINTMKLSYLSDVSSELQSQINSKASITYVDSGLAGKLNLSGSNANQNINLGSFKVQSNATPTASTDYITKAYGDSTYATTSALSGYLPLTGGTLSGALTISSGALTANSRLLGVPDATTGGNFWIGLTGSDNEDKRLAISIIGDQVSGTCSGVTVAKPLTVQTTETISLFGTNAKTTPSINFTTTGNHYNDTAGTTYLMNAPSGEMMLSYSTTRSATVANLLFGAANTDVSEIVSISGDGTTYLPMNMGASRYTIIGNNMTFASRDDNPITSQVIIKGKTTSERLYLGAYYTGGEGSGCSIQSSDFYSSADHGTDLLLNPIGGSVCVGTATNSFLDPVSRFTVNTSYFDDQAGGICINASDGSTSAGFYRLHIFPYVQSGGNVAYRFRTINQGTAYDSFTVFSTGSVGFSKNISVDGVWRINSPAITNTAPPSNAMGGYCGITLGGADTSSGYWMGIDGGGNTWALSLAPSVAWRSFRSRAYDYQWLPSGGGSFTIYNDGTTRIDRSGGADFLTFYNSSYSVGEYINIRFNHNDTRSCYIQSYLPGSNRAFLKFFTADSGGGVAERLTLQDDFTVVKNYLYIESATYILNNYQSINNCINNTDLRLQFRDSDGYNRFGQVGAWQYQNNAVAWTGGVYISYCFYKRRRAVVIFTPAMSFYTSGTGWVYITIRIICRSTNKIAYETAYRQYVNITSNHTLATIPVVVSFDEADDWCDFQAFASGSGVTSDINDTIWWNALVIG